MSDYAQILAKIKRAAPSNRIDFREELVALGVDAIPNIADLMVEPGCTGLAISALEQLAHGPGRGAAVDTLRSGRDRIPARRAEIDAALERLGAADRRPGPPRPPRTIGQLHRVPAIPETAGTGWPGFQEHEFGAIANTVWRSRDGEKSLAPVITRSLRSQHEHFDSYGVERRPQIHFFLSDRYRWGGNRVSGWRAAKLVVYAHGPTAEENRPVPREVVAGLYVEKTNGEEPYGPLTEQWDWVWFVRALRRPDVQAALTSTMSRHGLLIGDYRGQGYGEEGAIGGVGEIRDDQLTAVDGEPPIAGWNGYADFLESLPADRWHDLHIWKAWPAEVAMEGGQAFAMRDVFPVLQDLARIYLMIMQDAMPAGDQNYRIVRRRADGTPAQLEFAVSAHEKAGHFSVPTAVMSELGIADDGQVTIEVRADWELLYTGTLRLKSRNEVYPLVNDPMRAGLEQIAAKQLLHVLIEKAGSP